MSVKVRKIYPHAGHRKRLRDRFMKGGLDGFLDYEIVELLLTLNTPRRDCKPQAKAAIRQLHGLRGVLDASLDDLQNIQGIGQSNAFGIKLFQAIAERYAKVQIPERMSLNSPHEVAKYLQERLKQEKKEHFFTILLDSQNKLIDIRDISVGILDSSLVHPREVFEQAIKQFAAKLVIAHNHPSGDLVPSDEDLKITQRIVSVGDLIGIQVIDHIIVSYSGFISLRQKNLM